MGLFSKDIKSMEDLFLHTLQDVYYAENQIVKSLPKMIEKATNRELASGLRSHLAETEQQVSRLEQAFEALGETPRGADCPAMDGLLKEADNVAGEVDDKKVLDAAIIGSAQAIEHYEISRYGSSHRLGRRARPRECRSLPEGEPEGREGGGQEAQHACRSETQSQGDGRARGCRPCHRQEADRSGNAEEAHQGRQEALSFLAAP